MQNARKNPIGAFVVNNLVLLALVALSSLTDALFPKREETPSDPDPNPDPAPADEADNPC